MPARTLSVEKRTFIALEYQKTDDVKATLDAFQLRWPEESRPSKNTPGRLLTKLKEKHTLGYLYPKEIKKRAATQENVRKLLDKVEADETLPANTRRSSTRQNNVGLSKSTANRILKANNKTSFKARRVPKFRRNEMADSERRISVARYLLDKADAWFEEQAIFTDEKLWSIDEHLNRQTHRQWSDSGTMDIVNDVFVLPKNGHSGSVMAWFAMWRGHVYVQRIPNGQTVTGPYYKRVLMKFHKWLARKLGVRLNQLRNQNLAFMQDGAPAHGTELNLNYLASKYAEIISRRAAHSINRDFGTTVFKWWPSHSPDLTPCDHWLFSFMKERVYCDPKPETEDALWERIEHVAETLEPDLVKKVMRDGIRKWARKCLRKQGFYAE